MPHIEDLILEPDWMDYWDLIRETVPELQIKIDGSPCIAFGKGVNGGMWIGQKRAMTSANSRVYFDGDSFPSLQVWNTVHSSANSELIYNKIGIAYHDVIRIAADAIGPGELIAGDLVIQTSATDSKFQGNVLLYDLDPNGDGRNWGTHRVFFHTKKVSDKTVPLPHSIKGINAAQGFPMLQGKAARCETLCNRLTAFDKAPKNWGSVRPSFIGPVKSMWANLCRNERAKSMDFAEIPVEELEITIRSYIDQFYHNEIDRLKSPISIERRHAAWSNAVSSPDAISFLSVYIHDALVAKREILNSVEYTRGAFIKPINTGLVEPCPHEGLVLRYPADVNIKLVDRNGFSRANFSNEYTRGFEV